MFTAVYGHWNAFESDVLFHVPPSTCRSDNMVFRNHSALQWQEAGVLCRCVSAVMNGQFYAVLSFPFTKPASALELNRTGVIAAQKPSCLGRSWKAQKSEYADALFVLFLCSHRDTKHYLCSIRFATLKESQIKSFLSCSRWEATWFMTAISLHHIHLHANIHLPVPCLIFRMMFTRNKHTSRSFIYL